MTPETHIAARSRIDEEGDWLVRQFVPADQRALEPEEYVARHAHALGAFSFHLYRFNDQGLGAWTRRVGELLASESEVERCRERFLTAEEREVAQRQDDEDL